MLEDKYLNIIKKLYPELIINSHNLITEGWESDILIINNEKVYRFMKENNRFDCVYEKEKSIIDIIKPLINTPIPNIEIYKDKEYFFTILDYIKGNNLYQNQANITNDLVDFLKDLHSIDIKHFINKKLDADNLPFFKFRLDLSNFSFNYDKLFEIFATHNLENDFNNCINTFTNFDWNEKNDVICHNDLHKGNILAENNKITGIIDFGDTIYTNYNIEFISIFKWQDPIVLNIKDRYEEITERKLDINFITSIIKLFIYSKMSYTDLSIEKYLKRINLFTKINELYNTNNQEEYNKKKRELLPLFNDKMVKRYHK